MPPLTKNKGTPLTPLRTPLRKSRFILLGISAGEGFADSRGRQIESADEP